MSSPQQEQWKLELFNHALLNDISWDTGRLQELI